MSTSTDPGPPRASAYAQGSAANMARSLLVIGALMAVLFFMVARTNVQSVPKVQIDAVAQQVSSSTNWPIDVVAGLPDGWTPSAVRYVRSTGGFMTWHLGYQTPQRHYVAVEQTKDGSAEWIRQQTNRAPKFGTVTVDGRVWDIYIRDQKTQNSLVRRPDGSAELTTLVTGDGTIDELKTFAEHLLPYAR